MRKMRIIDTDVHINEPPEELAEFCEMPWRKAVETIRAGVDDQGSVSGLFLPRIEDEEEMPYGTDPPWPGGQNRPLFVTSPKRLRKDLDSLGVDSAILFPDHLLKLPFQVNGDYAVALAKAYNKWMVKKWLRTRGLYGAICTAPQDPEASAKEIRKLARVGKMVCVYLPTAAVNPLYGHSKYYPVYEAAEKAGLPCVLHGLAVCHPSFPNQLDQFNEIGRHGFGHSLEMAANFMHLMSNGVPARFPKLKFVFQEAGLAWIPWMMWRINNEYNEWRGRLLPFLKKPPSHYMRNFYFSTQPSEEPNKPGDYWKLLEIIGLFDNIVYASDWPHHDFDHPSRILDYPMPGEVKRKIMSENGRKLFKIKG